MLRMTCVGSLAFYVDKKREALLPLLLSGAKKARGECTKLMGEYLRCLPTEFVRTDMESFTSDCKKLLALLFPKKKEADADERPLLASIVVAMGRHTRTSPSRSCKSCCRRRRRRRPRRACSAAPSAPSPATTLSLIHI